ncbi:hypothetical protein MEJ65_00115 [Candidatus Carsonella ruddii]|uniref:Elongation factor Ts n=1 Tax=Carsonella ruddii TaxID=114186 RepID=A0AAJ6FLF5_CARRU|nr:hypothetical protein [Candidatus Carsonella ruddii]WGS66690.1 hypothetical protein MEJ66_00115 [Candidatus Carsonella ruddii]WGS66885.1 hypothetical protein MEJ62_00110 [Candidatus Carsonella ruddii]WGS67077.1 hypothetical protein MEJ60_00110 [Candidatus Carsonella ruddii]WGS67270.1 hypothetical protein MEJ65_00115 [Candidatus Carsonella ruddii]WMC18286.1 MAG: hypothetical protein NU472_00115 [Candidatus Carsonella ruddii]
MLNIDLIIKIKKKFNFNIGECKKLLEKNYWNYEKTIMFIKNKIVKNNNLNFNFFSILTVNNKENIFVFKLLYNSIIINNSNILEDFKLKIKNINLEKLKEEILLLSLKLKEIIYLEKILIFLNKNVFFYNHKNDFFCLINYKKKNLNLCCQIIYNKINFINYKCKNSLKNQFFIQNNLLISTIFDITLINYIFLINKKNAYFYYE